MHTHSDINPHTFENTNIPACYFLLELRTHKYTNADTHIRI